MTDNNSDIPAELLSIDPRSFPASNESNSSPFDTLWTEFARSHPRLSPPRTPTRNLRHAASADSPGLLSIRSAIDLRTLEYDIEYDSNLMCPICHVPFINPIVLDCDHTFCSDCFQEYRTGGSSTDRSRCPTCRRYHLGGSRKASRLINNMCNDIRVTCPNQGCDRTMARGCIELHATKECPEHDVPCPDIKCSQTTKKKNFIPEQCIHKTHIECECGASIRLGQGEWIRHKDGECPLTTEIGMSEPDSAQVEEPALPVCPGSDFGCDNTTIAEPIEVHIQSCLFARLAPHFKKQTTLIDSLAEQLKMAKIRNEVLETGLERLAEIINVGNRGQFDQPLHADEESDVEEIERHDLTRTDHHDMLPADMIHEFPDLHSSTFMDFDPRITQLEVQTGELQSRLSELDARSSMTLMNETLRIREELAHLNGAMYSTRSQVQWLLNRERILGQRDAMAAGGAGAHVRGRPVQQTSSGSNHVADALPTAAGQSSESGMNAAWSNVNANPAQGGSGPNSAATSPMFGATRPSMRRSSGGSQERVKL